MTNFSAKLTQKEKLTEKVYRLEFELENPTEIGFKAGQFVNLKLPTGQRRSYSLSNSPADAGIVETYVDVSPMGPASQFFLEAELGTSVQLLGPVGRFVWQDPQNSANPKAPVVLLATGTGISPFLAMLREQLEVKNNTRPVKLYWGLRTEADLYLQQELADFSKTSPNFECKIFLSREEPKLARLEIGFEQGYITHGLDRAWNSIAAVDQAHFFLCGGPRMIDSALELLRERGIPESQLFSEKFY